MRDLTFAYPTSHGVVDTIAWEGYREGIDDIRYGSTLNLVIQNADQSKRQTADEAKRYLESLDPAGDVDVVR